MSLDYVSCYMGISAKHWLPETLVNLKPQLKLFMIAALAGDIASLLELNTQHYLLLFLAVDRCSISSAKLLRLPHLNEEGNMLYPPLHSPQ